jgi:WD40 repeat protein
LAVFGFDPNIEKLVFLKDGDEKLFYSSTSRDTISKVHYDKQTILIITLSGTAHLINCKPQPELALDALDNYHNLVGWIRDENSLTYSKRFVFNNNAKKGDKKDKIQGKWVLCGKCDDWRLMVGGSFGYIAVWNHRTGKYLYQLNAGAMSTSSTTRALTSIAFNDSYIVASSMSGNIYVWGPKNMKTENWL